MLPVIEARAIRKVFGKETVLDGVSVSIEESEFVAIMGPSGCGKSTLLHILGCMDRCTSGELTVCGRDVNRMRAGALADMRRAVFGFVFQAFYLDPYLTVARNLEVPLYLERLSGAQRRDMARQIARAVGVEELLKKLPKALSGGEQQRVAIGRALIAKPKILLLDEPTGNLDGENTKRILLLLKAIHERQKVAIIVVTHDEKVARVADRIIRMKDGVVC